MANVKRLERIVHGVALDARAVALARIGQACIAWAEDTGECHMCGRWDDGTPSGRPQHDDDCPVGEFIAAYSTKEAL